jgi:MFS family permease
MECTREQICEAGLEYRSSGPFSIYNWVQQYDILCMSDNVIGLLGSMIYLGQFLSAYPFSWLADYYGRRWTLSLAALFQVLALLVCFLTTSFELAVWMMLLCGIVGTIASSTVGFVYMCEFLPSSLHDRVN